MESVRTVVAVSFFIFVGWTLSACSDVNFQSKKDVVSKSAFGDGGPSSAQDPRAYNEDEHRAENNNGDGDGPPSPGLPEIHVDVERDCSNNQTKDSGNVIEANLVSLIVFDDKGNTVCQSNKNYRSAFLNFDKMSLDVPCAINKDGRYKFRFFDLETSKQDELGEVQVSLKNGQWEQRLRSLHITYGPNYKDNKDDRRPETLGNLACEDFSSPLVVKLRKDRPLRLSSPSDGILFDINGERGGHIKRRISWPVDDTIAFVALPDKNGLVHSVDQLFGDNTKGPDGQFADNGYHALAKYDLNDDDEINEKDAIYSQLRLFIDANRDGFAQAGELTTLSSRGIKSIDLVYDPDYAESDVYGNKILFKSVAETRDDDLLLIFDIWFRHID